MEYADWLVEAGEHDSALRAEIERLEKEVERQEKVIDWECVRRREAEAQRDTAWNDAIEAAASAVTSLNHGRKLVRSKESVSVRAAAAIRALKRSQS